MIQVTAAIWSTNRTRSTVLVTLGSESLVNERPGSDEEVIADYGPHMGLIVKTHWGLTPFGHALAGTGRSEGR